MKTWPENGIILCEKEQTWCAMINIKTGRCKSTSCNIHDDEYIANRKMQIAKLRKETETQKEETEKEKLIKRKYEEARQLYKIGKTNRAQEVEKEIIKLKKRDCV
ncbi:MAG: hypothetical protein RSA49_04180 [Anaerovoracaceae bacterium]|uniref:hypothetical protein n=1 Tax=Chryseobacterium sp. TaxID=1871047 RepID=UPI002FC67015